MSRRARVGAALVLSLAAFSCSARSAGPQPAQRIRAAETQIVRHPRHYPAAAELALAHLEEARRTLDPRALAAARAAARRSLAIQANVDAYKAMAAIEGFAHRFDAALHWAQLARAALPQDGESTARIVDALLGLGRVDAARHLLAAETVAAGDFHRLAALAAIARASDDDVAAAAFFERAAAAALSQGQSAPAVWAHTMAAAALLATRHYAEAEAALAHAARLDPESPLVELHRAEFLVVTGQPRGAAELYARTLRRHPDAEGLRHAMLLALAAGDRALAGDYRQRAEVMLLPAARAGEVYTLGELARLYRDSGVDLARAEALAEANLRYVHDREARQTLRSIRARRASGDQSDE